MGAKVRLERLLANLGYGSRKDVAKAVKQSKPTRQDEAKKLWAALTKDGSVENAKALADYKRKVKLSWEVLGLEGGKVQPKLNKILGSSKK